MKYVLALLIFHFTCGPLWAEDITSLDFAAGYYLEVPEEGTLFSLDLPEEVYSTVKRPDLGDLRVFNGEGQVVPHDFRAVTSDPLTVRAREKVPFFPLYRGWQGRNEDELSLRVRRNSAGTIINVESVVPATGKEAELNGYLLDVGNLDHVPNELEFHWSRSFPAAVFFIRVEKSNDLINWAPLVPKAALVDLEYGGQMVKKNTVQLPNMSARYLKLTWLEKAADFTLVGVTSLSGVIPSLEKRRWKTLGDVEVERENGVKTLSFTSRHRLPVDSAQIGFSEVNSLARFSVESRPDEKADWAVQCEQLFYRLVLDGETVQSEPCAFPAISDRFWRLVVKEDGAGLDVHGKGLELQLGWTPIELLFIGRGGPPFLLAFGSGRLEQQKKPDGGMVSQAMQSVANGHRVTEASLGKRVDLGGQGALKPPPARPPWKKWLLWLVLLLGVAILAFMARSLAKEMKTPTEERKQKKGSG